MSEVDQPPTTQLLRNLTAMQHVLFGVLVVIGVVQGSRHGAPAVVLIALSLALTAWYAVGARRAGHSRALSVAPQRDRRQAEAPQSPIPRLPSPRPAAWLIGLTIAWVALVVLSRDFVSLAFALWLLAAHVMRWRWAILYTAATLAVVVVAVGLNTHWSIAGVIGPTIGALFALLLGRGQVLLARDALERSQLVESLLLAQRESAALHEELLATQREVGALAERTRLSRDIHDTLAQGYSSILLLARGGSALTAAAPVQALLTQIESVAAQGLTDARSVVKALIPESLDQQGIAFALERLLRTLSDETGLETKLHATSPTHALPTSDEVALLRIAQGALANVRRHAQAHKVVVSLGPIGSEMVLDVVDDGVGFDPQRVLGGGGDLQHGGYGLIATAARLRELGGSLAIESSPGDGCALSARIPLRRNDESPR